MLVDVVGRTFRVIGRGGVHGVVGGGVALLLELVWTVLVEVCLLCLWFGGGGWLGVLGAVGLVCGCLLCHLEWRRDKGSQGVVVNEGVLPETKLTRSETRNDFDMSHEIPQQQSSLFLVRLFLALF